MGALQILNEAIKGGKAATSGLKAADRAAAGKAAADMIKAQEQIKAVKGAEEILPASTLKLKVRPPSDNVANVRDANFQYPKMVGNQTVGIDKLSGGVRMSDPNEVKRVKALADQMSSPEGYISRIIVDHNDNVIEGQHRLEALRQLGIKDVPVYKIEEMADTMPVDKMMSAVQGVGAIHPDHVGQIINHALESISKEGINGARQMDLGRFQKHYDAALGAIAPDITKADGGLAHFAAGGSSRRKADVTEALTEGLAPMLYGGAKGALASLLGFPGELEQLGRTGVNFSFGSGDGHRGIDVAEEPFLPNTKRVSGALPNWRGNKTANQVAEMGTDLGENIVGTMLDPMAALKGAKPILNAAKMLTGSRGTPSAAQAQRGVIKMPGGNWLKGLHTTPGNVEQGIQRLRPFQSQESAIEHAKSGVASRQAKGQDTEYFQGMLDKATKRHAVNQWVENNLQKYVKNEMGTPVDPVRLLIDKRHTEIEAKFAKDQERADKMAERAAAETDPRRQANMSRQAQEMRDAAELEREYALAHTSHLPKDLLDETDYLPERDLRIRRGEAGFPKEGMGQSELAKKWENLADENIWSTKAGKLQAVPEQAKLAEDARAKLDTMATDIKLRFNQEVLNKPGSKLTVQERSKLAEMPVHKKAEILGNTEYDELAREYQDLAIKTNRTDTELAKANPWVGKVDPNADLYSGVPSGLGFDHIIDVLKQDVEAGRIRPEQLNKISMEQAVRRTAEYDQEMAKVMREAQIKSTEGMPLHKEYPEGYRWIELTTPNKLPEGYTLQPNTGYNKNEYPYKVFSPEGKELYAAKDEADAAKDLAGNHKLLEDALKYEGDTMGHCVGGYCPDVVEGRSRIYSLRDTKNEPHVTVEVQPSQHLDYNDWYNQQPTSYKALLNAKKSEPGYDRYQEPAYLAAREALPPRIVQIKGKQNAAPKEDYLPFVQDFVRGGKWSDVGDFRNTGLIRKSDLIDKFSPDELDAIGAGEYLTKGEHDDLMLKALQPPKGMKRGGAACGCDLNAQYKRLKKGGASCGCSGATIEQEYKLKKLRK